MSKRQSKPKENSGLKGMKLIAIKEECYAISGVPTTIELKRKYPTLCSNRDFRQRKTWEYVLQNLRFHGDWLGLRISDIEYLAEKESKAVKSELKTLVFHAERVEMDKAAENDD
ncbi:MAG: hypothetical protein VKJ02_10410 [Snowella sp.]|nr:hypothetical protein [Snowella sp.]